LSKRLFLLTLLFTIASILFNAQSFASVIATEPITQTEDGNIDPRLLGSWGYFGDKTLPKVFIFNQDGSFFYYSAVHMLGSSTFAMESVMKGTYKTEGNRIIFDNVYRANFDRKDDNVNRNLIGDRAHAKDMLNTTTDFVSAALESREFTFIENGVVRIATSRDADELRTKFRADWETYSEW
jgi:hypothetical protein